jgi:hypothetical protein
MSETTAAINDGTMIEKFDPSKLMDGVKDRIKSTFVSLIPDDAWEKMVEKEIYVFTTGRIELKYKCNYDKKDENGNYVYEYWEERTPYTGKEIKDNWGHKQYDDISPLQKMIRDALHEKFHSDLVAYLDSDEYKTFFDENGNERIKKTLEDMIIRNSGTIFVNIISGMMQRGIEQMKYEIKSQNGGY